MPSRLKKFPLLKKPRLNNFALFKGGDRLPKRISQDPLNGIVRQRVFHYLEGRIMDEMRIDKWLWAARFFKTRSAAQEEVSLGRVLVDGSRAKPSRSIRPGNLLEIRRGEEVFKVYVEGLSNTRGPAAVAQKLYRETQEKQTMREATSCCRRKSPLRPSVVPQRRPTKKERTRTSAHLRIRYEKRTARIPKNAGCCSST